MRQDHFIVAWPDRGEPKRIGPGVVVRFEDGRTVPALLTDLTADGCQLRTDEPAVTGERIIIVHEELGILRGEVRWSALGKVGVLLDHGQSQA